MSYELAPTERQDTFINALVSSGGNIKYAAEASGFAIQYCYLLKSKLAEEIAQATRVYLALNGPKAAKHIVDTLDAEMPNPVRLTAAKDILDRIGVSTKNTEEEKPIIKQNIFILPEKRPLKIIDVEFE